MTDKAVVLVAAAALAALPAQAAAQRASKTFHSWGATLIHQGQRTSVAVRPSLGQSNTRPAWGSPGALRLGAGVPVRVSWSAGDVALASAFTAALLIDAGQTRGLARGGWQTFREMNPILGPRPSVGQVNTYTAVAGLTVLGVAAVLPARLRRWLLGAALGVEMFTIAGTVREGVAIRIP